MLYMYRINLGVATLNKGDDFAIVKIGKFKNDFEALAACKAHYQKACKALEKFNKPIPNVLFM